ncbi:CapA family protein [Nesterenkonia haasae]|uniref:CapA family protein n=1 Tax=Nesterenkonia haasae TaxID=2587813 RepID=UPI001390A1D3|nr:CapA family protein [Nesterenkonia haasae]NDK31132.1 CapA family protein [Nesterenkonia haasae]
MTLVFATGDLVLEREDCSDLLSPTASLLSSADVVIGHLEVPHTGASVVMSSDVPAQPGPPGALDAVAEAGFSVLTLAGNHVFDFGGKGIEDSRRHCQNRGITPTGAGRDLTQAWEPAVVTHNGRRLVVLSVNCVGPRESWAGSNKPGCAFVDVITHYESRGANPGGPPRIYTFAESRSLASLKAHINRHVADDVDIVVSLHKGLVHQPAALADYEYEISHAVIDAGASAVLSHHAHILKGVEVYRGRPIFHGLGNFATVTTALNNSSGQSPERRSWARERIRLFGFEPDPMMPEYPFHPESRNTAIAALEFGAGGLIRAQLIPCWIDDNARPLPVTRSDKGQAVGDYIERITEEAGLRTTLEWQEDRLNVKLEGSTL